MATHTERLLAGLGKLQEVLQGENAVGGGKEDLQKALDALNPFDALSSTQDQEMDLLFELFRVREAVMKIDCKVSTLDKVCNALIWTVMRAQNLDVPKKLGRVSSGYFSMSRVELGNLALGQRSYGDLPLLDPGSGASTAYTTELNTPVDLFDLLPPTFGETDAIPDFLDAASIELPMQTSDATSKIHLDIPQPSYAIYQTSASRCQPTFKGFQLLHYPGCTKTPVVQPMLIFDELFGRYKLGVKGRPSGWGSEKYIVAKGDKIAKRVGKRLTIIHAEETAIQLELESEADTNELVAWIEN